MPISPGSNVEVVATVPDVFDVLTDIFNSVDTVYLYAKRKPPEGGF